MRFSIHMIRVTGQRRSSQSEVLNLKIALIRQPVSYPVVECSEFEPQILLRFSSECLMRSLTISILSRPLPSRLRICKSSTLIERRDQYRDSLLAELTGECRNVNLPHAKASLLFANPHTQIPAQAR